MVFTRFTKLKSGFFFVLKTLSLRGTLSLLCPYLLILCPKPLFLPLWYYIILLLLLLLSIKIIKGQRDKVLVYIVFKIGNIQMCNVFCNIYTFTYIYLSI